MVCSLRRSRYPWICHLLEWVYFSQIVELANAIIYLCCVFVSYLSVLTLKRKLSFLGIAYYRNEKPSDVLNVTS